MPSYPVTPPDSSTLPLAGVKVLDLTRALAGPYCTMILADLGADVIKVEPLATGDMIRHWGPHDRGVSVYYLSANRNKRGLALDFYHSEASELLCELAAKSDIVVENFKPGSMDAMNLSYERLAALSPALIYASVTGFGRDGPAGRLPGFDQIAQGYSGLMSLTGTTDSGPTRVGVPIGDQVAGMWAALGIMAAFMQRQQTGQGQRVETSLLSGLISLLSVQGQRYLSLGQIPTPSGNSHPVIAPYGAFDTADGPLNIAPATNEMWRNLCKLLDLSALCDDPCFKTNKDRVQHRAELTDLIEERLRKHTREYWLGALIESGIPTGPINNMADVFSDAQVNHCNIVEDVEHPELGLLKLVGSPIGLSSMRTGSVRTAPPLLGQHTEAVLSEYGVTPERIATLLKNEVVAQYSPETSSCD